MKVLFVTSEAAPIKKFGGLGDFSGSLPIALSKLGIDVDVVMPYYSDAKVENLKTYTSLTLEVPFNNEMHHTDFVKTKLPSSNVDLILVKQDVTFSGDFLSDVEFFAFFDKAVVEYVKAEYNTYDLVHCNDWHTGFITHLLNDELSRERPRTLLTIHNLGYQGISSPDLVREIGIQPGQHPLIDWDISDGDVNMLLQGITSSDYLNTVSETYAKELLTPEFAGDFLDVLTQRSSRLIGIVNGIDYHYLPRDYDISTWKPAKSEAKEHLFRTLKLKDTSKPVFSFISRIDIGQKGLDILLDVIPFIVNNGGNFILLGTGDSIWEDKFRELTNDSKLKDSLSINIEFDVKLANEIYKASEFFLIPSKYEPCGLTQMMSMWYGCLPIAHKVGGLADTIIDSTNGFLFDKYLSKSFEGALARAFEVFRDKAKFNAMVENAMQQDFSWGKSAKKYRDLYNTVLKTE
jgi:starch synthase